MNKEATTRSETTQVTAPAGHSMQRYLRYLKSDLTPVLEAEQYSVRLQLNAWRDNLTYPDR
jgi:hypothetical protein